VSTNWVGRENKDVLSRFSRQGGGSQKETDPKGGNFWFWNDAPNERERKLTANKRKGLWQHKVTKIPTDHKAEKRRKEGRNNTILIQETHAGEGGSAPLGYDNRTARTTRPDEGTLQRTREKRQKHGSKVSV